jgi:hypothetical protein
LESGWNAFSVEKLMKQYGVKTWGGQITGGEFFFSVKLEQAQWAEYLLNRHNVPILPLSQGAPRPKQESNELIGNIAPSENLSAFLDNQLEGDKPPFFPF